MLERIYRRLRQTFEAVSSNTPGHDALPNSIVHRAFLSHSSDDKVIAVRIHRKLESYRIPRRLVGQLGEHGAVPKRLRPIFLDRADARPASELEAYFTCELTKAQQLIVLCSPSSASPTSFVGREIDIFREVRAQAPVHAMIVGGIPPSCFPEQLMKTRDGTVDVPLAADRRSQSRGGDGARKAFVKLVAAVAGVNFDALWQRDKRRRRWRLVVAATVVVLAISGVFYTIQQRRLNQANALATDAARKSEQDSANALNLARKSLALAVTQTARDIAARAFVLSSTSLDGAADVISVECSPNGELIVTASAQSVASVFDATTGQKILDLKGHAAPVQYAQFSPNGRYIVTASKDGTARLWNATEGDTIAILDPKAGPLARAEFSRDGNQIMTIPERSRNGTVTLWQVPDGVELKAIGVPSFDMAHFSPSGDRILTIGDAVSVWDSTGQIIATLDPHASFDTLYEKRESIGFVPRNEAALWTAIHRFRVQDATFSPNGKLVAIATDDGVRVWEASTSRLVATFNAEKFSIGEPVKAAVFSVDGTRVLCISDDGVAYVLDVASSKLIRALRDVGDAIKLGMFSPDGRYVVTTSSNHSLLWDANSWQLLASFDSSAVPVRFSPDGQRIVTNKIWSLSSAEQLFTLEGHTKKINRATFSPSDDRLLTASDDGTASVWSAGSGERLLTLRGHGGEVNDATFSADGRFVATGSRDRLAIVWNASSGKAVATFRGHRDQVFSVLFSPDGARLLTTSADQTARIWESATGNHIATLQHGDNVVDARFSVDNLYVVTASLDHTAKVWDGKTGQYIATLPHRDRVYSVAFSPDSKTVVTGSADGTISIWSVGTGRRIYSVDDLGTPKHVGYSPDGQRIISASNYAGGGLFRVWDASLGRLIFAKPFEGDADLRFSLDGGRVVAHSSNEVAIWNSRTGALIATLTHQEDLNSAELSKAGDCFVTTGEDKAARVYCVINLAEFAQSVR